MGMEGDCRAETEEVERKRASVGRGSAGSMMDLWIHDGLRLLSQHRDSVTEGLEKPKMIHLHKSFHLILSLFFLLTALTKSA